MSTSNHKTGVSQEQDKRHKRTLAACVKEEGNRFCADCGCRGPTWASVNLGVFVCLTCSGIHRSLGVHISQVRSTTLDTWLPKQVTFVTLMGNVKANKYWEKKLPVNFVRPSDTMKLTSFIRSKYVDQLYVPDDMPPPNIENYKNHPYCSASTDIASMSPQEETQTKPIGLKGTPKVSVLDPPRKTTLVMGDFLDFQDDKQSVKSDPTTSTDWAQFESTPDSSLIVDKVEQSGVSWSAFGGGGGGDQSSTKTTPPTNLLDSQPKIDDPFGLDALQNSPPSIAAPVLNAVSNEVTNEQGQHQQTLDNILKLYDAPKPRNEAPLPPNLGLPMGSVHGTMPGLYSVIPGQSAGVYNPGMPMPQGGLYPQSIMVPQMGFQQPGYYQPQGSNGYFHQSYNGQGPR